MSPRLPEKGLWRVAGRHCAEAAPFDLLKLDLRGLRQGAARGAVRLRNLETRLGRIRVTGQDRFAAVYDIRGRRGEVEGTARPDGSLRLTLSGTVTGSFVARPAEPACADAPSAVQALAKAMEALCRPAGAARTVAA
jgi:hypothetical protein